MEDILDLLLEGCKWNTRAAEMALSIKALFMKKPKGWEENS
jgi:hypothetical protein